MTDRLRARWVIADVVLAFTAATGLIGGKALDLVWLWLIGVAAVLVLLIGWSLASRRNRG